MGAANTLKFPDSLVAGYFTAFPCCFQSSVARHKAENNKFSLMWKCFLVLLILYMPGNHYCDALDLTASPSPCIAPSSLKTKTMSFLSRLQLSYVKSSCFNYCTLCRLLALLMFLKKCPPPHPSPPIFYSHVSFLRLSAELKRSIPYLFIFHPCQKI